MKQMMKQTTIRWQKVVAWAALGVSMTGASARADEPRVEGATFLRLLHAFGGAKGAPKVDVFVDGEKKLNDVAFGTLSSYLRLPSGRHKVSVWTNSPARVLLTDERDLKQGAFTTIGAYGTPERARLLAHDDSRGPQPLRQGRLTVFNLAPGSPPLEILASSKSGGTYVLARRVRYGRSAAASMPPEPTTLRVRVAGRTVESINTFEPRAGQRYVAYVIGQPGANLRLLLGASASR